MINSKEMLEDIVAEVGKNFRTFGGGSVSNDNPISAAMKDRPAVFAAGVDVMDVVEFVSIRVAEMILSKMKELEKQGNV